MRPPIEPSDLKPEARAFVESIAAANDPALDVADYLDSIVRAGSRIEHGAFTRLSLHDGLSLPELDLRGLRGLEEVSANAVGWKQKSSRVLLGEQPRLKKLLVGSHGLSSIDLSGCTALLDLDVSYNALTELTLPRGAPLEILNVTGNALGALDLSHHRALARLELMENRLTSLDLTGFDELRGLLCAGNPITSLVLPTQAPLKKLGVSRCPLGTLDVRPLALLETLFCDACGLDVLDVSQNARLTQLSCDDNGLRVLDVTRSPLLTWLSVRGNPLASLDVRALDHLATFTPAEGGELLCTERQKRALPALRARFGIRAHPKLADKDLWELDLVARSHNWDDGVKRLLAIAQHPRCDLGTALMIYWNGEPEEMAAFATTKDAGKHERAVVELLRTIEKRVAEGGFATREVRFEGRESEDRRIPPAMRQRVG